MNRRDQAYRDQPTLFDPPPPQSGPAVIDPNVRESDRDRLTGQNASVMERLESGPATNDELARISRKYTSRISDVRRYLERHGRTIECIRGDGGLNTCRIVRLSERGGA